MLFIYSVSEEKRRYYIFLGNLIEMNMGNSEQSCACVCVCVSLTVAVRLCSSIIMAFGRFYHTSA